MPQPASTAAAPRVLNFNGGWRFALGDPRGACDPGFDDAAWRELRLPHDWSVDAPFDPDACEGATGYLPGGIGWYRKRFTPDSRPDGSRTILLFDGVYNHADVWLNGQSLGTQHYGYAPFSFDVTEYLAPFGENVLAVRVDHSRYCDSRWYTGSGIYRDVKLVVLPAVHIPVWGTFVTTPEVSATEAAVSLRVEVSNTTDRPVDVTLATEFTDPDGAVVSRAEAHRSLPANDTAVAELSATLSEPRRWARSTRTSTPPRPCCRWAAKSWIAAAPYSACAASGSTPSGGSFLTASDRDQGRVPASRRGAGRGGVPRGVWARRLAKLKAAGCNAIRTAHNPPSEAFLDLCDEMGFLVQHEFFDEWESPKDKRTNYNQKQGDAITRGYADHFAADAEGDLKRTMRRDRNHSCVFMWSIGNEIEWCYPSYRDAAGYWDQGTDDDKAVDYYFSPEPPHTPEEIKRRFDAHAPDEHSVADTARRLAGWVREMDTTRPVTANLVIPSVSHQSGYTDALDVVGYSYRAAVYDYGHRLYPDQPIIGSENWTQWHEWEAVLERDYIAGIFLWTGIDYLGEAAGKWPVRGSSSGLLDTAGFEKPPFHLFKSLWSDDPHAQLFTQMLEDSPYRDAGDGRVIEQQDGAWRQRKWGWHDVNPHWNYRPGDAVVVEAYTNCDSLELFLNGDRLGVRRLADHPDRICKWLVDFAPGTLEVRDASGRSVVSHALHTAAEPAAVVLTADRTELFAGRDDVAHVVAQLVDAAGHPVRTDDREVVFASEGAVRLVGVDNGAVDNVQPFAADRLVTRLGRTLLIVKAGDEPGGRRGLRERGGVAGRMDRSALHSRPEFRQPWGLAVCGVPAGHRRLNDAAWFS